MNIRYSGWWKTARKRLRGIAPRKPGGRPKLMFEMLEQRLPLITTTASYSITIVEDLAGDGVSAQDPLASEWKLFGGEVTTINHYTNCQLTSQSTSGESTFLPNGSSVTYSTTTGNCSGISGDGQPFTVENVIYSLVDSFLTEQPPIAEYWRFTGSDCGSPCVLDHPVKNAYFHDPSVRGVIFHDHDGDGTQDGEDELLPDSSVCLGPAQLGSDACLEESFFRYQYRASQDATRSDSFAPRKVVADRDAKYLLPAVPSIALRPPAAGRLPIALRVTLPNLSSSLELATTGNLTFDPATPSGAKLTRNLGAFHRSKVSGFVYLDRNGNGQQDVGETQFTQLPLTVLPDSNHDNQWISAQDCPVTNPCLAGQVASVGANGTYSVLGPGIFRPNAPADRYSVTEGSLGVVARSGEDNADANFGIFENVQYIFGNVFDDKNKNGVQDAHGNPESTLPGITIKLDLYNDGGVDRTTVTDQSGAYRFNNIGPGTHRVFYVEEEGKTQTFPTKKSGHEFSLMSGQPPPVFEFGLLSPPFELSADEAFPTEGVEFSAQVATIRTKQPLSASAYTVTVDWGDRTTSPGTVTSAGQNGGTTFFDVKATHTYQQQGKYPIKVTVSDSSGFSTTSVRTSEVVDAPLTAAGFDLSGIEGQTLTTVVASFDDQNPFGQAGEFTATIDWGDGQVSSGTIVAVVGVSKFEVSGTNIYKQFGSYTAKVEIRSKGGSTVRATSAVTVQGAPLKFTEIRPDAVITEGRKVQGEEPSILAAFFHDNNSFSVAGDFDATIDWGDGTVSKDAFVSRVEAGRFFIRGKHTYTSVGSYPIRVQVSDEGDSEAEISTTTVVTGAPLTGVSGEINAVRGVPYQGLVASFYDANSFSRADQFIANVNWGDGFRSLGSVEFVGQSEHDGEIANLYKVRGQHTYYEAADYPVTVNIGDAAGATTASSDAFVLFLDLEVLGEESIAAIEGTPFTGLVGTITDPGSRGRTTDYRAEIDWGDGEMSHGEIRFRENFTDNQGVRVGVFDVFGTHMYATPGEGDIAITVNDSLGRTTFDFAPVVVANAALSGEGRPVSAQAGVPLETVVATFTDADLTSEPGEYLATIDWADGTISTGTIRGSASRGYEVTGSHTYQDVDGSGEILVEIVEPDGDAVVASSPVIVTPPPDPSNVYIPDLTIEHIEAVQVVQHPDNSIPLVAGKSTVARVFIYTGDFAPGPIPNVTAILRGFRNGVELAGSPLTPRNNSITAPYDINPVETDSSLNFAIPPEWTVAGDLRLEAEVNPTGSITESRDDNNTQGTTVTFIARNPLDIAYIAVCYQPDPDATKLCPSSAIATHDQLLAKLFPISAGGVEYRPYVTPELIWRDPLADIDDVYELLAHLRSMYEVAEALGGDVPDQLAAWLPLLPETEVPLGLADPLWMGSAGRVTIQQDTSMAPVSDAVDAQFSLAHEIAHNLGRFHVDTEDGCGSDDPFTDWPYDSAMIGELGFDPITGQVVPSDKLDVLSYCSPPSSNIWISPFTYERLFEGNLNPQGDPRIEGSDASRRVRSTHEPAEYLVLQGSAASDGSQAELTSAYRITSTVADPLSDPFGNYCIHVSDIVGFVGKYCFTLDFEDERTQEALARETFSLVVPIPSGATNVALRYGKIELDEIEPSQHAPSLDITSPQALDNLSGVRTITWTATDVDNDPLKFVVLHSSDAGSTWTTLAFDLSESEFSIDTNKFPAGLGTYFRVLVSDGWFTTEDTVGPVTLPGDRPWQNPTTPLDVNRNTTIEPQDVLVIINELNQPEFRDPTTGRLLGHPGTTASYYDPSGDGFCTPLDALLVINFLNNRSAEGESVSELDGWSLQILVVPFITAMQTDQVRCDLEACGKLKATPINPNSNVEHPELESNELPVTLSDTTAPTEIRSTKSEIRNKSKARMSKTLVRPGVALVVPFSNVWHWQEFDVDDGVVQGE